LILYQQSSLNGDENGVYYWNTTSVFLIILHFRPHYAKKNCCPKCGTSSLQKFGKVTLRVFTRRAWQNITYQRYRCVPKGHVFHFANLIGMYSSKVMEYISFLYLRSLSFQQVRTILSAWFEKAVIAKDVLISAVETVADSLPTNEAVTIWLQPIRSGYYALDGTWLKYRGQNFVLLILFDVETLDVVSYQIAYEENYQSYHALITKTEKEIGQPKGLFCDGDPGLLKVLKERYPSAPTQLCVFHKYSRVGQIACFVHPKSDLDREIKRRVEKVLFAPTKEQALSALAELKQYAIEYPKSQKLKQVIGILKRNFDLLLTHYDNPEMSPYNNVLEGFNYLIKRRTRLMKGFKKPINISRWIKLLILDWRFHPLTESEFKNRRGKTPLELSQVQLPKIYNWITFLRKKFPKKST